jgi:hypothetical protein
MSDDFSPDPGTGSDGDSVTEVTTTGWLSRILQSIVGALIGILLVIGAIVLLWWNEGRAVEASRALVEGARQVVEVQASAAAASAEGKLVHLSGMMETKAGARDTAFGSAPAISCGSSARSRCSSGPSTNHRARRKTSAAPRPPRRPTATRRSGPATASIRAASARRAATATRRCRSVPRRSTARRCISAPIGSIARC